ncbi:MAG: hypothetical protein U9O87_05485 [Verrucomicrobiota bacterium]|nr:hypothetical protein [Verrucomicrobiota bacterium]
MDSLSDADINNYDQLWIQEAKKRDKEISENKVISKSHNEVMQRAKKELICK